MDLKNYQKWTKNTAVYPGSGTGNIEALSYVTLGLVGEAGEVANKAKKLIRDGDSAEKRTQIADELGDICWYMARLAEELGVDLADLLQKNHDKLESRLQRNVLQGSGDNR